MDKERAQELINKYLDGTATIQEKLLVEDWYSKQMDINEPVTGEVNFDLVGKKLYKRLNVVKTKTKRLYYRVAAVATFLLGIGAGLYYFSSVNGTHSIQTQAYVNDVAPGKNKAFLILAGGKRIVLTDANNGTLAEQNGVEITKSEDGQLVYTVVGKKSDNLEAVEFNTIETPKGGQYQLRLPDGSNVWLNAASSLTFPTTFAKGLTREVKLSGEAYFEIAHNKEQPFVVKSRNQKVEVLGTHFNVDSYDDEPVKTTLLEGSVRVLLAGDGIEGAAMRETVLKPNQQSVLQNEKIDIAHVDAQEAIAWKKGEFTFNNETLESIMNKIARWYDVEVVYQGVRKTKLFGGTASRFAQVSGVLKVLELTNEVHFKIEGRRITVMK